MANGRGVAGKRGIGDGKGSHKTSGSKAATPGAGFKKTAGNGKGKGGKK